MFGRKGKTMKDDVSEVEQQVEELDVRMLGPHHAARRAVGGDAVLTAKLDAYEEAGGEPIALGDIPVYRRAQHVDEQLTRWETLHSGGPCSICGSASRRWGKESRRTATSPDALPPGFTARRITLGGVSYDGALCAHCQEESSWRSAGVEGLLEHVLTVAAGYRGTANGKRALAFCEVGGRPGAPWGHLDPKVIRSAAVRLLADGTWWAMSRLIGTERQAAAGLAAGHPGLRPLLWGPEDLAEIEALRARLHAEERARVEAAYELVKDQPSRAQLEIEGERRARYSGAGVRRS